MMKNKLRPTTVEPTEDGQRLRIVWSDGHTSEYEPRPLRLACPCAGCIEEMTGRPLLNPATVPDDVMPVAIHYVGRYALRFVWSDGHDLGIYPWDLLRRNCPCEQCAAEGVGATGAKEAPRGAEGSGGAEAPGDG